MFIEIDFASGLPIYEQIRRQIIINLAKGNIKRGDKLPSVRELAENIGINLHTVNKAYKLLENDSIIQIDRRVGSLISNEFQTLTDEESTNIKDELLYLLSFAKIKNLKKDDLIKYIEESW